MTPANYDVVIVGAGAAGLFCAATAGQRGLKVLLVDHAAKVAEKIRISGGGRCNFTNLNVGPNNYLSSNPSFCRSALARFTPQHFIDLLQKHGVAFHEKHRGQLFCDRTAQDITDLLLNECQLGGVRRWQPCAVTEIHRDDGQHAFQVNLRQGEQPTCVTAHQLVIATGGLPVPKIGASDFGMRVATQFKHRIVSPRPALVPLTFPAEHWKRYTDLAGLSLEVGIQIGSGKKSIRFLEDLLFTHRGLSGPAILQISSYWHPGTQIRIDLSPHVRLAPHFREEKQNQPRRSLIKLAGSVLPNRLAQLWLSEHGPVPELAPLANRPIADLKDNQLDKLAQSLNEWTLTPSGTEGWAKAEVMAGGVDTAELSSQTFESKLQPGLFFIGEVVDVTGWLGGYNFQWAWASAAACANALQPGKLLEV